MKIISAVYLLGSFCVANVVSQVPAVAPAPIPQQATTPLPGLTIPRQVMAKTRQLRWDFDQMMSNGGLIDNQKLIGEVSSLAASIQANLQTAPSLVQSQVSNELAIVQSKIQQMTASGKFDAGVLHDLNLIAELVDVAVSTAPVVSG